MISARNLLAILKFQIIFVMEQINTGPRINFKLNLTVTFYLPTNNYIVWVWVHYKILLYNLKAKRIMFLAECWWGATEEVEPEPHFSSNNESLNKI